MIKLPDQSRQFEYEDNFYLSCDNTRLSKFIAHFELFKLIRDLPGAIVECGIFHGTSFVRFAGFRALLAHASAHKLIGFDSFGKFPSTNFGEDKTYRKRFIRAAGEQSISKEQLNFVLRKKSSSDNVELIAGDITKTVPQYIKKNPHLKIAFLNLDTDIYEPAVTILEHLYPRIVRGGVLILDDYGIFPGETKAVDDYFKTRDVEIKKFPFALSPCYIIKP